MLRHAVTSLMRTLLRLLIVLSLLALFVSPSMPTSAATSRVYLQGFPRFRQQHPLTCETSAASMGTRGVITEGQLMALIPRNPNPNLGFRGNPEGQEGKSMIDYGVYAAPVRGALLHYGFRSDVIMYGSDDLLASYLNRGWPVVVWITYGLRAEQPHLAQSNGVQFILVPFEHAVLVVGYDQYHIYANDPWTGKRVTYLWGNFNRAWGYFGDMALAMEPCAVPGPVSGLTVSSLTPAGITWTWHAAARALGYAVTVIRHGKHDKTVYQGTVTVPTLTLSSPSLKAAYEIAVQSISTCGATSAQARLWVQMPIAPATPTTTPIEGTLTPQPTGTVSASPPPPASRTGTVTPSAQPSATPAR